MPKWIESVSAFSDALGPQFAPLIFDLADVPWDSTEHRDGFIQLMTGAPNGEA